MRGVVAAGDRATAAAAAATLERGGNAVDAATAGAFAAFVAEPLLAGAGGAGMLTLCSAEGAGAVVDFFSPVPKHRVHPEALDFVEVHVDFGAATQAFHVGRGSVAPPLALPGLIEGARRFGTLPLAELVAPAVRLAREGVALGPEGAHVFSLLWPIQEVSPEATALASGSCPTTGTVLTNPALADLLEETGQLGATPPAFLAALVREFGPAHGGSITLADLEGLAPAVGAPREVRLGDWTALTSPRPGGALVERILSRLCEREPSPREAEEALRIAEACRAGHELRAAHAGRGSTTHLSVIDRAGGAASVTLTNGEGCGYVVGGFGVQMNNFLGEEDLNPGGFHRHPPGGALPTMIAPTIALAGGRPVLALGSGGSNRIRSVVSQVLYRVMRGERLEDAVRAPRIHAESDDAWIELVARKHPAQILEALRAAFARVHPFDSAAFYFGGVHAAGIDDVGATHGIGDARRGGAVVYV